MHCISQVLLNKDRLDQVRFFVPFLTLMLLCFIIPALSHLFLTGSYFHGKVSASDLKVGKVKLAYTPCASALQSLPWARTAKMHRRATFKIESAPSLVENLTERKASTIPRHPCIPAISVAGSSIPRISSNRGNKLSPLSLCGSRVAVISAKNHKRQRRNRQTRKVANAKGFNRNTNLT